MTAEFFAHSRNANGVWHLFEVHARDVAILAASFAECIGMSEDATVLGWDHDIGKLHPLWQLFIRKADAGEDAVKGPPHSPVGMLWFLPERPDLALLTSCHHGGLVDPVKFRERVKRFSEDKNTREALKIGAEFLSEHNITVPKASNKLTGLKLRMLHSCLVDADVLDTIRHMDSELKIRKGQYVPIEDLNTRFLENHTELTKAALPTPINSLRKQIFEKAKMSADSPTGLFSLTVPTGGGKTRVAMNFALEHAKRNGQQRVIVAMPYTSIVEQNAEVYRDIFGDGNIVLEHHSAVSSNWNPDESYEVNVKAAKAESRRRQLCENWDAPIIVTTNVQLFESLFASHNGTLRKLHNIANSVIILDEYQTVPMSLLKPTFQCLEQLVKDFGCSIVLSSATPTDPQDAAGLELPITEIIPQSDEYYVDFNRVEYENIGETTHVEISRRVDKLDQVLVIVNSVKDAQKIAEECEVDVLHLSTRLIRTHREQTLTEISSCLKAGRPCRVISTQVVEAGVDLDFPEVFRCLAPLDSIIQAAGRCNREGKREVGYVTIFDLVDGIIPPGSYRTARDQTKKYFELGLDLNSPEKLCAGTKRYFKDVFGALSLDAKDIIASERKLKFKTVSQDYRYIDTYQKSVVIVLDEGHPLYDPKPNEILENILGQRQVQKWHLKALSAFSISLFEYSFSKAFESGLIQPIDDEGLVHKWMGTYDQILGLMVERIEPINLVYT